jgi:hypothetical protein
VLGCNKAAAFEHDTLKKPIRQYCKQGQSNLLSDILFVTCIHTTKVNLFHTGQVNTNHSLLNFLEEKFRSLMQCCVSESFYYGSGSTIHFQKVPDPVSDPAFFLEKYDFKGPKMAF